MIATKKKKEEEETIQKYIQHIMEENLLLLKGLLEPERMKSTNIWLQY